MPCAGCLAYIFQRSVKDRRWRGSPLPCHRCRYRIIEQTQTCDAVIDLNLQPEESTYP
ncbi:hypothetical protein H7A76_16965 [Pseudomonas sp. MSSRFD41]|nr:hypothetical protein [Pseudomonas sp. MSSRFD41]